MQFSIAFGYLIGRGYWFWDRRSNDLFWNKQQCRVYGMSGVERIGTYDSLFDTTLWDDSDRSHVRKSVELALSHRVEFRHQFCVRAADTGTKIIVAAWGTWLFDASGNPWAMYGFNQRLPLRGREFLIREAEIKVRQTLDQWREEMLTQRADANG